MILRTGATLAAYYAATLMVALAATGWTDPGDAGEALLFVAVVGLPVALGYRLSHWGAVAAPLIAWVAAIPAGTGPCDWECWPIWTGFVLATPALMALAGAGVLLARLREARRQVREAAG